MIYCKYMENKIIINDKLIFYAITSDNISWCCYEPLDASEEKVIVDYFNNLQENYKNAKIQE